MFLYSELNKYTFYAYNVYNINRSTVQKLYAAAPT